MFQPLLYQVATGGLSPANIAAPLRSLFKRQANVEVLLGEVTDIDAANRKVTLGDAGIPYDTLVIATGVRHQYFGRDDWEPFAPGLKTVEDATAIRGRILSAFEQAERAGRFGGESAIRSRTTFMPGCDSWSWGADQPAWKWPARFANWRAKL